MVWIMVNSLQDKVVPSAGSRFLQSVTDCSWWNSNSERKRNGNKANKDASSPNDIILDA